MPSRASTAPSTKVAIEIPATAPLDTVEWVGLGSIDGVVVALELEAFEAAVLLSVEEEDDE